MQNVETATGSGLRKRNRDNIGTGGGGGGGGGGGNNEGDGDDSEGAARRSTSGSSEDKSINTAQQNSSITGTSEPSPSRLSTGVSKLSKFGGQSTGRIRKLPDWFGKSREDMEQQYFKGFEKRCDRLLRELQKSDGFIVRDIFRCENAREIEDLLRCIQTDEHYRRGLLQVCREDTHIHIAHDCVFSNGSCRCSWWQKAKTYGLQYRRDRRGHRRNSCRSRTMSDVQKLLIYYCSKGRQIIYQKIGGQVERIPSEGYNLSEERFSELPASIREVEIQAHGDGNNFQQWGSCLSDDEPDQTTSLAVPQRKKRRLGAQERIQVRIIQICRENPICPPEAIVKHKLWLQDEDLRFKTLQDKEIKSAINNWTSQLVTWSMKDYQELYSDPKCTPIFSAGYGNFDIYYYNVQNSIEILDELIRYQCGEDEDATLEFIHCLYNVLERKVPKLNCICIHSPPSAGKNFFFDAVKDYYINCGHLNNANKYNNFAFQDAEGRRIIMWNEPNYSPEFLEPIKELLGGDSTCVNVKYMHDTPVYRTPVIVLTNNEVTFMHHPAFKDRLRVFKWKSAPYLAKYDKKPNPLAIYALFQKYKVVE